MAARGAHLTGTTFVKPTIFEIVAKESLISTLEPAFKRLFSFVIKRNGEKYGWLDQWSDEAYAIFHGALENFYLRNYSASFSETFYGLKRIALINSTAGKLSWKQQTLSVFLAVLYPYLRSKADKYRADEIDEIQSTEKWKQLFKHYFLKGYKTFHFINEICGIYYYLAYIADYSRYPTPMFHLLSMTLTYSRSPAISSITELLHKWKAGNFHVQDGVHLLQRSFMRTLELGAFFLQFMNWWHQDNYHTNLMSLPAPPAPSIPEEAKKYKGLCPVCCKSPNIPVALAVSGYVFCYQCILDRIQSHGRCPVTNYPAKEDDLIRIYK